MGKQPEKTTSRKQVVVTAALLALGLILSGLGVFQSYRNWQRLPNQQDWQSLTKSVNKTAPNFFDKQADDADFLRQLAGLWQYAHDHPDEAKPIPPGMLHDARSLRSSSLGSYYAAAFEMLSMQRRNTPKTQWWQTLSRDLPPKSNAAPAHLTQHLIDAYASEYEKLGIDPATANEAALNHHVGFMHQPILQYLTHTLQELETTLSAVGDNEAAAQCRVLRHKLLKQWILESAPAGIRLLAVDLLADEIGYPTNANDIKVVESLHALQREYREKMKASFVDPLSLSSRPSLTPTNANALIGQLQQTHKLVTVTLSLALLAIAFTPWLFKLTPKHRSYHLMFLFMAVFFCVMILSSPHEPAKTQLVWHDNDFVWFVNGPSWSQLALDVSLPLMLVSLLLVCVRFKHKESFLPYAAMLMSGVLFMESSFMCTKAFICRHTIDEWKQARSAACVDEISAAITAGREQTFLKPLQAWGIDGFAPAMLSTHDEGHLHENND